MHIRLDKMLANMGYGTRKEVKQLLKTGAVSVDGEIVTDGKMKVHPDEQEVVVFGERVIYQPYIYLMMNKPSGVICATEDDRHLTVIDLLDDEYKKYAPFPVGRLDKETTGLLFITNDGRFAHSLTSPRRNVPKTYVAKVRGRVDEADVKAFQNGVVLDDGYKTKAATLSIRSSGPISDVEVTITEGKFHQVKRMFEAIGKYVLQLERVKIGDVALDRRLNRGGFRELTEGELQLLRREGMS